MNTEHRSGFAVGSPRVELQQERRTENKLRRIGCTTSQALKRMKRQQSLADFFNKKPKLESIVSELALDGTKRSQAQPLQPEESSTSIIEVKNDNSNIKEIQQASPKKKMKENFSSENIVALKRMKRQQNLTDFFNKKPKFESVVSELVLDGTKQSQAQPLQPEESITSIIEVNDNSKIKEIQQASPRKKMKEHFFIRSS
ncbi:PREDICTED: uncharacterized protein LOC106548167 isoform X2 [Thamnophis sirtalis]|uniref:Uncharacterized protein LOC106548167 isoform X2 n=1 Tax=Thamnophis sirtalis TaxID=35019 RepID=A0A6I9Y6S7_9SAUR|nr:PREDICTED: uncharacterized protein LOC106548167 isoform X2 [Thamnophis sirtalis]